MYLVPVNLPYQPSIIAGVWQNVRQCMVIQQKALRSTAKPARPFAVLSLSPCLSRYGRKGDVIFLIAVLKHLPLERCLGLGGQPIAQCGEAG